MAYQNVATPRFYIDHGLWLSTIGYYVPNADIGNNDYTSLVSLNPGTYNEFPSDHIRVKRVAPINYIAFLRTGYGFWTPKWEGLQWNDYFMVDDFNEVVNMTSGDAWINLPEEFMGFSIGTFADNPNRSYLVGVGSEGVECGAVSIGSTYDMPHSPNLSLTISREYARTKELTSINGSTISNTMWNSAPKWGPYGAWELHQQGEGAYYDNVSKSGRRIWDLTFSYIDDGDIWGSNQSLGTYLPFGQDHSLLDSGDKSLSSDEFTYNILTDNNFFSQVWHKTLGGTLKFIFQPDNSNSNPDQFAIAKFADNSLKVTQSAVNLYDVSLKIEEDW